MVVVVLFGISGSMVSVCIDSEKEDRNYSKKITKIILTQSSATATVIVSSLCIDKPMKTNKELCVMIRSCVCVCVLIVSFSTETDRDR